MNRLTLLGTGTCQLDGRVTSSALVELGNTRVVFDFGRGVAAQLAGLGLRQSDIPYILLSHFHPDHLSDLIPWLHAACWSRTDARTTELVISGPPGLLNQMQRLFGLFGPDEISRSTFPITLHELSSDRYQLGEIEFLAHSLPPAGNHGVIFTHRGQRIGLAGDSSCHGELVTFSTGLDLLVHDSGHSTDEATIELLVKAQPRIVVLSHLYRDIEEKSFQERATSHGYRGTVVVGIDRLSFDLDNLSSPPRIRE